MSSPKTESCETLKPAPRDPVTDAVRFFVVQLWPLPKIKKHMKNNQSINVFLKTLSSIICARPLYLYLSYFFRHVAFIIIFHSNTKNQINLFLEFCLAKENQHNIYRQMYIWFFPHFDYVAIQRNARSPSVILFLNLSVFPTKNCLSLFWPILLSRLKCRPFYTSIK